MSADNDMPFYAIRRSKSSLILFIEVSVFEKYEEQFKACARDAGQELMFSKHKNDVLMKDIFN